MFLTVTIHSQTVVTYVYQTYAWVTLAQMRIDMTKTNHKWGDMYGAKCSQCGIWRRVYKSNRTGNNYYGGTVASCDGIKPEEVI